MADNNYQPQSTDVIDQLAEYRRRQAARFQESEDEDESRVTERQQYEYEEIKKDDPPLLQKFPEPSLPTTNFPNNDENDVDYLLAQKLQDEENQRIPDDANQPFEEDGVRPADSYRQETLIPDAYNEELERQNFLREQQLLFQQYNNNGNRPGNQPDAHNMGGGFQDAGNPFLHNQNNNNINNTSTHRRRELLNCLILSGLFSILIVAMFLVLFFLKTD
ncbi:unnamed protein product [Moneuplotes crassus]|uniref:Uncharacterized protein n=1 Tax=Euplotes crassus TaxID=5936 RepID=A0AAD1UKL3_EUPCR|nr:unnamed protein product [Moneuplotes crassus]